MVIMPLFGFEKQVLFDWRKEAFVPELKPLNYCPQRNGVFVGPGSNNPLTLHRLASDATY